MPDGEFDWRRAGAFAGTEVACASLAAAATTVWGGELEVASWVSLWVLAYVTASVWRGGSPSWWGGEVAFWTAARPSGPLLRCACREILLLAAFATLVWCVRVLPRAELAYWVGCISVLAGAVGVLMGLDAGTSCARRTSLASGGGVAGKGAVQ